MAKKPLEIDMIAGSQLRDTQGEMLSVEGADISELVAGRGRLNDNHGKGFFNAIGRITSAKKIFKSEDCDTERQHYYWDKVKAPFVYVAGVLFDDEDHPNARAAAAILRNIHKSDAPLQLKASVEGGVVARGISDPSLLARTKIHSVALTFTPANNNTLVEPVALDKSQVDAAADMQLIKSVMHLAQTDVPSFRHIYRDASANRVHDNLNRILGMMGDLGIDTADVSIPSKEEIIEKALEAKVKKNVERIHAAINKMKEEQLDKGVKSALMGAALGAASAIAPAPSAEAKTAPKVTQQAPDHVKVFKAAAKKYPLLGAIGMVESSGGKNFEHRTISSDGSMHKGHTAGGMFGMMPNSAAFVMKSDPALAKKYPKFAEALKDVNKNHQTVTQMFNSDPQASVDFAVSMFNRNKGKTKNEKMLAHSWLNGLKGSWNHYKKGGQKAIDSHPYVQKVMEAYEQLKAPKVQKDQVNPASMMKGLTAGYGGAGAPTFATGGSVIQAESLEAGRGFNYVNCDKCGKEQIHAKHQVKCRHCGDNWSLEKLFHVMKGSNR
jgi:hypothetical protein